MPVDPASGVYFEVYGKGAPLMLTLPVMASQEQIFGAQGLAVRDGYLALLDRYRVLLVDYPSIGRSRDIAPEELTADRVCADLLSVATAAGFGRFAYWGYSWGGAVGLQLASRTDRLNALVVGGWPPLDAPYREILEASRRKIGHVEPGSMAVLRSADQYRQWSFYYASMIDWPETEAVAAITCPRMAFFGGEGDLVEAGIEIRIASIIRANRRRLEELGWRVAEIEGCGHAVAVEPEKVAPVVSQFLESALTGTEAPA